MKQRRIDRLHGRIMSVETKVRGDALAADAAAAATTLILGDAGDFDEDGGWLTINGQVVEFTEVDDDEGIITLATGLDAAAEEGDHVHVWSTLYDEVVDYQEALVELDGEYDNPEPVVAEVAEGVGDLPEGDRGASGESCTLHRISDDEWEVVGVGGRARKSKGIRFEADDFHTITADDITVGTAMVSLSHRPIAESLVLVLASVPQRPTEYAVDYDSRTVSVPLDGWEKAGDRVWVHYAYRKGLAATSSVSAYTTGIDNPIIPPASAPAGALLLLAITLPEGHAGASNLNGYTLVGQTGLVTHMVGLPQGGTFGPLTYRMAVYARTAPGGTIPVPTFAANAADTVYVFAALPDAGAVETSAFGTVAESGSASTPTLAGANIHLFATLGIDQAINTAGVEAEFNNDPQINIVICPRTTDSHPANVQDTAAWMTASLKVGGL